MQALSRLAALVALLTSLAVSSAWAQEAANEGDGAGGEIDAPLLDAPADTEAARAEAEQAQAEESEADGESAAEALAEGITLPSGAPDYEAWARIALRAEQAIEAGRASDQALGSLRDQIVEWRDRFAEARSENRVPLATLRNQIAALGPAPAEGASESETLAAEREALNARLAELERPVIAADLAYARADTIISEIDDLLRTRQAEELMSPGASPLAPGNWSAAAGAMTTSFNVWLREIRQNRDSPAEMKTMRNQLAFTIFFAVFGLVMIFGARRLPIMLGNRIVTRGTGPSQGVWSFLVSLGEVVIPVVGILSLLIAFDTLSLFGPRSLAALNAFTYIGVDVVIAGWIGARVFGRNDAQWEVLNLSRGARTEGRIEALLLGLAYGVHVFVRTVSEGEGYAENVAVVLQLPVMVFTAIVLWRIGRLLRTHARQAGEDAENGPSFRDRLLSLGGQAVMLVSILGPVMNLLGYNALADFVVYGTVLSLALVGVLLVVHVLLVDLYGTVTKRSLEEAQQALVPVLGSLVVFILSLPLFSLIWGARAAELGEIWTRVGQGIQLGESRITPYDILTILIVFAVGFGATRLLQGMLKTSVLPKTRLDIGGRNAITSGIGYVGYFLAAIIAVTTAGINLSSLAVVAGALSVGIGFGLQNIVSNFVSGIILLIERPVSEGDWIDAGGQMGIVKDISVRSTTIETFDKTDVVIPNSDLISGVVTNYTRGNRVGRLVINVGVGYASDTHRVSEILMEVAENHPMVAVNPAPQVSFMDFGADALMFQIRAILSDVFYINVVRDEFNHEILTRFRAEGIEIPFAQRDLWLRNPEALVPPRTQAEPAQPTTLAPDPGDPDPDVE
ncbi:DUF3772 domain-containing protein [Maritimibacter sp. DP1N21-5]|uniref:DUF3772 domain-containing protein n=1 Tax=Maritimibacter sp. DP1N21-5 TaxID=2836867 RepID=UPI001C48C11C|nr:DUF3772 domain-containing protein [Maritimibacter sp. DP1N21-5]MBV7409680.1 DUF3772 domain-containing protein [Maritimibacter sp. DP1N21-5]